MESSERPTSHSARTFTLTRAPATQASVADTKSATPPTSAMVSATASVSSHAAEASTFRSTGATISTRFTVISDDADVVGNGMCC